GMTIMAARAELELECEIRSDTAPLHPVVLDLLEAGIRIHCLRDPTRGGVATALAAIAERSGVGMLVDEAAVPVRAPVRGRCELLGLDPLSVAKGGRLLAIVPAEDARPAVERMRRHAVAREACIIGDVVEDRQSLVVVRTAVGGRRIADRLPGEQLP